MALSRSAAALSLAALALAACSHDRPQAGLSDGMGLYFNSSGATATLAYGRASSDDVGLVLQCQAGSRSVEVSDVARSAGAQGLTLTSGRARTSLPARVDSSTGQPTLWASTDAGAPVLKAFQETGRIGVSTGGARYTVVASPSEMDGVRAFFRACAKA